MLKATSVDTTPSARRRRRGAAPAIATGPDSELIRAAAEMERAAAAPGQTDRQVARANNVMFAAVDLATQTPAATDAGLVAKA